MSGLGGAFGGYPLASLFGQGQMGPIQPQMPPQGGGASPFMQGASPQGAAPFMQGAPPPPAQPGIAPGAGGPGAMSPLAKQMMMMKMMQGGGQGGGQGQVTPAMLMNSIGMMR